MPIFESRLNFIRITCFKVGLSCLAEASLAQTKQFSAFLADFTASSTIQYAMIAVWIAGSILIEENISSSPALNISVLHMLTKVAIALR
jgi:hypothetical protein